MLSYIIRRTFWMVVTLFFIVLIAFVINFVVPGNPARTIAGPKASAEVIKMIEQKYDLDKPVYVQFEHYFGNLVHGDLGMSYRTNESVSSELKSSFPKTVYLGLTIFFLNVLIGVPTGIYAAIKRSKFMDHVILISSLVGTSAPTFWIGYILLFVFGFELNILPIGGYGGLSHVILPAITVSLASAAGYVRVVRTSMLEVLGTDYVRTAEAKGLPQSKVIFKHAFRSSLIPLITYAGMDLGTLMGGLIVTEGIFGWPGIGKMAVTAITYQDMPTIMGVVLVGAVAVVIANFVVDIIYAFVDPRISY